MPFPGGAIFLPIGGIPPGIGLCLPLTLGVGDFPPIKGLFLPAMGGMGDFLPVGGIPPMGLFFPAVPGMGLFLPAAAGMGLFAPADGGIGLFDLVGVFVPGAVAGGAAGAGVGVPGVPPSGASSLAELSGRAVGGRGAFLPAKEVFLPTGGAGPGAPSEGAGEGAFLGPTGVPDFEPAPLTGDLAPAGDLPITGDFDDGVPAPIFFFWAGAPPPGGAFPPGEGTFLGPPVGVGGADMCVVVSGPLWFFRCCKEDG